ncbi:hypothetical protein MHBO_004065 [Bonamia ostreae]|uniref:Uncharacterized protein n=1 Tax=Bonamia ostreae TaxID=126728 RepID=A0ABV2AS99_9EUKA
MYKAKLCQNSLLETGNECVSENNFRIFLSNGNVYSILNDICSDCINTIVHVTIMMILG